MTDLSFEVMINPHEVHQLNVTQDSYINKDNLEEEALRCPGQFAFYGTLAVILEERELILKQGIDQLMGSDPTPANKSRLQKMQVERSRIRKSVKLLLVGKRAMELKNIAVTTLLARASNKKSEPTPGPVITIDPGDTVETLREKEQIAAGAETATPPMVRKQPQKRVPGSVIESGMPAQPKGGE